MGGYGSTRWGHHSKRKTVEDGLRLRTNPFLEVFKVDRAVRGSIMWGPEDKPRASIGFTYDPASSLLRFQYVRGRGTEHEEALDYNVGIARTPLHFGGERPWFLCPLMRAGHPCLRRCGKLYLPPGARHFGCRTCHDLTYTSSQEAHKFDSLYQHIAGNIGCSFEDVKRALGGG